jgi:hypothetical protein
MKPFLIAILLFSITCFAQDTQKHEVVIHVSKREYPLAEAKAKLVSLLIDSLKDQGRGIVDVKREAAIRTLMRKIDNWPPAQRQETQLAGLP